MRSHKVLHIIASSQIGGATISLYNLLRFFDGHYQFLIAMPRCGPMETRYAEAGYQVEIHPFRSLNWFIGSIYKTLGNGGFSRGILGLIGVLRTQRAQNKWLVELVQREGIAIIHFHSVGLITFLPALKRLNSKVVWHIRETLSDHLLALPRKVITRRIYQNSDSIIAITGNEAKTFEDEGDVNIVHNFVDFSQFDKEMPLERARRNLPAVIAKNSHQIVGMMAQFNRGKGIEEFVKAAITVHSKFPQTKFMLKVSGLEKGFFHSSGIISKIGKTNTLRRRIRGLIDRYNAHTYVVLITESIDIPSYLRMLDIFVRPDSLGCPWGRDIIEAMAMALPVIATGTCEEFVVNEVTGILVPPKNPQRMADAILELLDSSEKRKRMGDAGYERARELFDAKRNVRKIEAIYEQLLADAH